MSTQGQATAFLCQELKLCLGPGLINPSQTRHECVCILSALLASKDAGEPQPSVTPIQGTHGTVGKLFPYHLCYKAMWSVSSLLSMEPKPEPSTSRGSASQCCVLALAELTFLYLFLHLIPYFYCPNTSFPPRIPPNNPLPIIFPSVVPGLLHLYPNSAFWCGQVASVTPGHPPGSHQFYFIPSTGFIFSLDSPAEC